MKEEMLEYFAELNTDEQRHVLDIVKTFIARHVDENSPMSIEEYNREIDEALEDVARGNYITHEDLKKEAAEWRNQ